MKANPPKYTAPKQPKGNDEGGRFVDRDLTSVSPLKEQFEPTSAEPVRQRFKMAGGC